MVKDFRLNKKKTPIVSLNIDGKTGNVKAKIHKSKSSLSQIKRWENAKIKKNIFEKYNPKSEFDLKDFGKKNNPLDNNIEVYNMSVQVNYQSEMGGLQMDSQTFQVIVFKGIESKNAIEVGVKTAYENMIYLDDGKNSTFNPGFQSAISQNTKIDFNEIRGLEQTKEFKLKTDDYIKLQTGNFIVKDLNAGQKAQKNKKGKRQGTRFNVKLDLSEFM